MIVYRLCKSKYSADLSGKGAEMTGARWNSKGTALLYTSQTIALCTTEIAVHTPLGNLPMDYCLISLEIPENSILELAQSKLPADWKYFPHPNSTQKIGDQFARENKHLILKVPSAVVQGEFNFILNPFHPDFSKVKILKAEAFTFDERLFKA